MEPEDRDTLSLAPTEFLQAPGCHRGLVSYLGTEGGQEEHRGDWRWEICPGEAGMGPLTRVLRGLTALQDWRELGYEETGKRGGPAL